jgi:2',3'-cyclic-nucleotide 2'-phosphodiesterase/3'-nucleotidase
MKQKYLILAIIAMLLSSCSSNRNDIKIDIYQTSDVHGAIFPFDFIKNEKDSTSLAQVYGFIKTQRADSTKSTFLFDNGDILQGQPTVYYSNFIDTTKANIVARVMNYMKYDAGTVGNHDIEPGHAVYDKIKNEFKFPWLAANAVIKGTDEPYFQPYAFFIVNGIKIVVIGLITPSIPNWLPPTIYEGIEFTDMEEAARHWVEVAKAKQNPDIIIGMFHSGVGDSTAGELAENASKKIAMEVPGFDAIFCGHDHHEDMEAIKNVNGDTVWLLDPASRANYLSHVSIDMKWNKSTKKYDKKLSADMINISGLPADSDFIKTFQPDFDIIKNYVNQDVAFLEEPLTDENLFYGNNKFLDLIHKVQLEISGADISFSAPLQAHLNIPKGELKVSDLFKLYRYENLLYTMELSGQEIKNYLEYSYSLWVETMKTDKDEMFVYKEGTKQFKNPYYNFDDADGINYTVDLQKPVGERVKISGLANGKPFDLNAKYKVAINSYRGNGGGGHLTLGAKIPKEEITKRILKSTDKDLRFYMMEYLKAQKDISLEVTNNWKFIPEKFVEAERKRNKDVK